MESGIFHILYADGLKKAEQAPLKETLGDIPVFNLTKEKLERLEPEDASQVKMLVKKTKEGFDEMLDLLDPQKYPKARVYIENLSTTIATFFDWWLENKAWLPINNNAIESAFSQVKNRVWSIGRRWSDTGLPNLLRVTMKKIFFPKTWRHVWDQFMSLNQTVQLTHIHVNWRWYIDPITEL